MHIHIHIHANAIILCIKPLHNAVVSLKNIKIKDIYIMLLKFVVSIENTQKKKNNIKTNDIYKS